MIASFAPTWDVVAQLGAFCIYPEKTNKISANVLRLAARWYILKMSGRKTGLNGNYRWHKTNTYW